MNLQPLAPYLSIAEIILGIVLTVLVLLQSKGSDLGLLGGGGGGDTSYRTKRGIEATMHRLTIYFAVAFFVVTFFTFIAWGQAS